jgi:hypothetical protein
MVTGRTGYTTYSPRGNRDFREMVARSTIGGEKRLLGERDTSGASLKTKAATRTDSQTARSARHYAIAHNAGVLCGVSTVNTSRRSLAAYKRDGVIPSIAASSESV